MDTVQIANILGFMGAGIGIFMFIPQAWECYKTKNTKSISILSFSLLAMSAVLWTAYGVIMNAYPIVLVNSVIFILSIFILILKKKYG